MFRGGFEFSTVGAHILGCCRCCLLKHKTFFFVCLCHRQCLSFAIQHWHDDVEAMMLLHLILFKTAQLEQSFGAYGGFGRFMDPIQSKLCDLVWKSAELSICLFCFFLLFAFVLCDCSHLCCICCSIVCEKEHVDPRTHTNQSTSSDVSLCFSAGESFAHRQTVC